MISPQPILNAVTISGAHGLGWVGRGIMPAGYYDGMALTYAQACRDLKIGSRFALEMAKAIEPSGLDALHWYGIKAATPQERLHWLFTIEIGLGVRESSGEPYCGMDTTNPSSDTASTAEAGLFQMSWNSHAFSKLLPDLMNSWPALKASWPIDPSPFFLHGISTRMSANIGSGDGADFQALCKREPAFAAYYAAVLMRNRRDHWGPLNTHAATISPTIDKMLTAVAAVVAKEDA